MTLKKIRKWLVFGIIVVCFFSSAVYVAADSETRPVEESVPGTDSSNTESNPSATDEPQNPSAEETSSADENTSEKDNPVKPVVQPPHPGWNKIGGKYYYYNSKLKLLKNTIIGNKRSGYHYVDSTGVRVDDKNIKSAVSFVMKNTKPGWSKIKKLKACYKKIVKKYKFKQMGSIKKLTVKAFPGRVSYFFKKKKGDCIAHAATLAMIAKVIGYQPRVMRGTLYRKYKSVTYYSDHGYTEIKRKNKWYIYDLTMERRAPGKKFVNVVQKKYHKNFKVKHKKYFTLTVSNGVVSWK